MRKWSIKYLLARLVHEGLSEFLLIVGAVIVVANVADDFPAWVGLLFIIMAIMFKVSWERDFP